MRVYYEHLPWRKSVAAKGPSTPGNFVWKQCLQTVCKQFGNNISRVSVSHPEWETLCVCVCFRARVCAARGDNESLSTRTRLGVTMWSTDKTLELIELLHSSPALWDVTSEDYKNIIEDRWMFSGKFLQKQVTMKGSFF